MSASAQEIPENCDNVPPPPQAFQLPENQQIQRLNEGNRRYLSRPKVENKFETEQKLRKQLADFGQEPWAIVLSCSDSRVPVERLFDAKPGDLFVVRVAGNIAGSPVGGLIGSVEYGVEHLRSKVLFVMGHTKCGAVTTAVKFSKSGEAPHEKLGRNLGAVVSTISPPALEALSSLERPQTPQAVDEAIRLNVLYSMERLIVTSSTITKAVREERIEVHGGIYDIETGEVKFLGKHPRERAILREVRRREEAAAGAEEDYYAPDEESSPVLKDLPDDAVMVNVLPSVAKSGERQQSPPRRRTPPKQAFALKDPDDVPLAEAEEAKKAWDFSECLPTFSWMVETKLGKQHLLKQVATDPNNWRAGLTVALVSVPLSISLGIASGTTPMRGLSCAVFGGLCAGIFGSSDYNIVGPAGALSGMLMSYTVKWGDDVLPWLSLVSAGIVAVCGILRLDTYMLLMPTSVFEGFTVGVALIIGLNQINFACGLIPGKKHHLFMLNIIESLKSLDQTKASSLIFFLIQAPLLWFLMRKIPKIPWTIIMPVLSIPFGALCDGDHLGFDLLTLKSKYGMLKPELVVPLKPLSDDVEVAPFIMAAFSIAVVAVLETLISAKIAATRVDKSFNLMREMRGLTVAHAVCGLTGSMPPTGVFVRTSLNTSLGATHRFAQALNSVFVALISLALMPVFSYLPQASIAAILVVAAVRMTPMKYLLKLWNEDKSSLALCLITAAICVAEDPVIGLAAGMALAFLITAKKHLSAPSVDVSYTSTVEGRHYRVAVVGALTYTNAEVFLSRARKVPRAAAITLDLSGLRQVDHDGVSSMGKVRDFWSSGEEPVPKENIQVENVCKSLLPKMRQFPWFEEAEAAGCVIAPDRSSPKAAAASPASAAASPRAFQRGGA